MTRRREPQVPTKRVEDLEPGDRIIHWRGFVVTVARVTVRPGVGVGPYRDGVVFVDVTQSFVGTAQYKRGELVSVWGDA